MRSAAAFRRSRRRTRPGGRTSPGYKIGLTLTTPGHAAALRDRGALLRRKSFARPGA